MDQYDRSYQSNLSHDFAKSFAEHQFSGYHGGHISGQYHGFQCCLPMIDRRYFTTNHLQQVPFNTRPQPYVQPLQHYGPYQQRYIQQTVPSPFPQATVQNETYNHMPLVGNGMNPYLFNECDPSTRVVKEEIPNVDQHGICKSNEKVPGWSYCISLHNVIALFQYYNHFVF